MQKTRNLLHCTSATVRVGIDLSANETMVDQDVLVIVEAGIPAEYGEVSDGALTALRTVVSREIHVLASHKNRRLQLRGPTG